MRFPRSHSLIRTFLARFFVALLTIGSATESRADCYSPTAKKGAIQYFSAENVFKYCSNTTWTTMKYGGLYQASNITDPDPTHLKQISGIAISGNLAIAVDATSNTLIAFDISNGTAPVPVGSLVNPSLDSPNAVAVSGNYAYVAGQSTLSVIDISNPANPSLITSSNQSGHIDFGQAIVLSGNIAYVLSTYAGLAIYSISNPTAPALLGSYSDYSSLSSVSKLAISGNTAYVAGDERISAIDITNKSSPSLAGSYYQESLFWHVYAVSTAGNSVFVTSYMDPLKVFDFSNKASPKIVFTSYDWGMNDPRGAVHIGNQIYVAASSDSFGTLETIDVTTPADPTWKFTTGIETPGYNLQTATDGTRVLLANMSSSKLMLYDLGPREAASKVPTGSIVDPAGYDYRDIAIVGNRAVAVDNFETVHVLDMTNPADPAYLGRVTLPESNSRSAGGIAFDGSYAYIGTFNSGILHVIDVRNPTAPVPVKAIKEFYEMGRMQISGQYLYVTDSSGLSVVDISDPPNASVVARATDSDGNATYFSSTALAISGNKAYLTRSSTGSIASIDISDPLHPLQTQIYNDSTNLSQVNAIAADGNLVYTATNDVFMVLDVSGDPFTPVGTLSDTAFSWITSVTKVGNTVLVGGIYGLTLVDVSTPSSPTLIGTPLNDQNAMVRVIGNTLLLAGNSEITSYNITNLPTPNYQASVIHEGTFSRPGGLVTSGAYAYAISNSSIKVISLADPSHPSIVATIDDSDLYDAQDLSLADGHLYVAGRYNNSIMILSLSNPALPVRVGFLSNGTSLHYAQDVKVNGNYAYVAGGGVLTVVNVTNKANPTIAGTLTNTKLAGSNKIDLVGNYAYVLSPDASSLSIIDISNAASPTLVGSVTDTTNLSYTRVLVVHDNFVYIGRNGQAVIVNATDPAHPSVAGTMNEWEITGLLIRGSNLLIAAGSSLSEHSLADPAHPSPLYYSITGDEFGSMTELTISGNLLLGISYAYTSNPGSFAIWDMSPQSVPRMSGSISVANSLAGAGLITTDGNRTYVLSKSASLMNIFDVSDPKNPVPVGSYANSGIQHASIFAVSGNRAYIPGEYWGDIQVIDITNPASPSVLRTITAGVGLEDMKVAGSTGYGLFSGTFYTFNAAGTGNTRLDTVATGLSNTGHFEVSGNYAYACAESEHKFVVLNVADPSDISVAGSVSSASIPSCKGLYVSGGYAYVATYSGLTIVDISNPAAPAVTGAIGGLSYAYDVIVTGNRAYVLGVSNLYAVDITNRASPVLLESTLSYVSGGGPGQLAGAGDYLYIPEGAAAFVKAILAAPPVTLGACSQTGMMDFDSAQFVPKYCDGTTYYAMGPVPGAGGAGCSSPTAKAGAWNYDTTSDKYRYCNGASWITNR